MVEYLSLADWLVTAITVAVAAYVAYGTPIILFGAWHYRKRSLENEKPPGEEWDPPDVSVLVAVRNEAKVVGRLLWSMSRLSYPKENLEVIVAEDGSTDRTLEVCKEYAAKFPWIKVFHRDLGRGKADALNFAFHKSKGQIVATFDADAVPEPDCIKKALRYFDVPEVGVVYGRHRALNPGQSLISRLLTYEMLLFHAANLAKYKLGLFVGFSGSNTFVRRTALEQAGLWDTRSLVEDVDLAVRLAKRKILTRLAPITSWDETPGSLASMVRQRIRWSGGNFQLVLKHWDSWRKMPWSRVIDMYVVLMSPAVATLLIAAGILLGLGTFGIGVTGKAVLPLLMLLGFLGALLTGSAVAAALSEGKLRRQEYLKVIFAVAPYAAVVAFANSIGMFMVMLGFRGRMWYKTEKTGYIDRGTIPDTFEIDRVTVEA